RPLTGRYRTSEMPCTLYEVAGQDDPRLAVEAVKTGNAVVLDRDWWADIKRMTCSRGHRERLKRREVLCRRDRQRRQDHADRWRDGTAPVTGASLDRRLPRPMPPRDAKVRSHPPVLPGSEGAW